MCVCLMGYNDKVKGLTEHFFRPRSHTIWTSQTMPAAIR